MTNNSLSPSLFHFQISREGSDWLRSAQETALGQMIIWEVRGKSRLYATVMTALVNLPNRGWEQLLKEEV